MITGNDITKEEVERAIKEQKDDEYLQIESSENSTHQQTETSSENNTEISKELEGKI